MAVVRAIGAAIASILIVLDLSSGEKKSRHEIEPLSGRLASALAGPPL